MYFSICKGRGEIRKRKGRGKRGRASCIKEEKSWNKIKPRSGGAGIKFFFFCAKAMAESKEEAFIESPKLCPGTFLLIFGQSQSGKSSFLKVIYER